MTENALEGLIEDVGHFVFEILSGDERLTSYLSFERYDLAAGSADVGVDVEGFLEVVHRCWT